MPYYLNPYSHSGLSLVSAHADGYSVNLRWNRAYPSVKSNRVAYQIYFSIFKENVFEEGPKFVSITQSNHADIIDLEPGQLYFFAVRSVEYDPTIIDPSLLLEAYHGLRVFPESVLTSDITATQLIIPLLDTSDFPAYGIIQAGVELINYLANDTVNNELIVAGGPLPQDARLVVQPDGYFYQPGSNNIGSGVINNLACVNSLAPNETWTIKCIFVQRDNMGNPVAGTAQFSTIGALSGSPLDPQGAPFVWDVYNTNVSNGTLSFSIQETSTFHLGDSFTVGVIGAISGSTGRGFNDTFATYHLVNGYDGYVRWSPYIRFALGIEELNDNIFQCQNRFDLDHYAFTIAGGYKQVTEDYLTTDLSASDAFNVGFAAYDYAGYRRTDPVQLLSGGCVGSYFGGTQFCADGYDGIGRQLRGLSFQERNNQNQEYLLSLSGEPVCLLKRQWTNIVCDCYLPSSEYPDDRCQKCYGTKFIMGYTQYFNPRRSDGRIMVRFSPAEDDLKPLEGGLESEVLADVWTLTVPTVKDRDFIVRFDQDSNEEFRYEVLSVNRNRTLTQLEGAQKFRVQRVRKFDPIYTVPVSRDTKFFPTTVLTTMSEFTPGLPPHQHEIRLSERIISPHQINQLTSIKLGHNHTIREGQVISTVHHTHEIIWPPPPNPINYPTNY